MILSYFDNHPNSTTSENRQHLLYIYSYSEERKRDRPKSAPEPELDPYPDRVARKHRSAYRAHPPSPFRKGQGPQRNRCPSSGNRASGEGGEAERPWRKERDAGFERHRSTGPCIYINPPPSLYHPKKNPIGDG